MKSGNFERFKIMVKQFMKQLETFTFRFQNVQLKVYENARTHCISAFYVLNKGKRGRQGRLHAETGLQGSRVECQYKFSDCCDKTRLELLKPVPVCGTNNDYFDKEIDENSIRIKLADDIYQAIQQAGKSGLSNTEIMNIFMLKNSRNEIGDALLYPAISGNIFVIYKGDVIKSANEKWFAR